MSSMSVEAASQVIREAMREKVKRHSFWYILQSVLNDFGRNHGADFPGHIIGRNCNFSREGLIFNGILQAFSLLDARHVPHFWLQLVSVVLSVFGQNLFLRNPGAGLLTLTLLLIVFFMVEGISKIIFSLTIRPFPNWGWIFASGVIGILLSFYLWGYTPVTTIWLLGVLLGIGLISEGAALGNMAWQARKS